MKTNYLFLTIAIILLLSFPVLSTDNVYLGSFSPDKETNIKFTINLKDHDNLDNDIILKFKRSEFISENSTIPNARMTIHLRTETISFQKDQTIISSDELQKVASEYLLPVNLKLFPQDNPGLFENTIQITNSKGNVLYEKNIIFRVNSWTKFELSKDKYLRILNNDFNNQILKSNGEVIIKVASNSRWNLYGSLNEKGKEVLDRINLFIKQDDNYKTVKRGSFQIDNNAQLITKGTKTVTEDKYWEEIEVFMEIEDIKNIKSGLKIFPVIFYLETIR